MLLLLYYTTALYDTKFITCTINTNKITYGNKIIAFLQQIFPTFVGFFTDTLLNLCSRHDFK